MGLTEFPASNMSSSDHPFRIFVVDDNAAIASSLAMILRLQRGLDVSSFTDPVEALSASEMTSPDLLISDMYMPHLSGIDLATKILAQQPQCKVILLSGDSLGTASPHMSQAHGDDFEVLIKPVHPADLIGRIERIRRAGTSQVTAQVA